MHFSFAQPKWKIFELMNESKEFFHQIIKNKNAKATRIIAQRRDYRKMSGVSGDQKKTKQQTIYESIQGWFNDLIR